MNLTDDFVHKDKVLLIGANYLGSYRPSKITAENLGIGLLASCLEQARFSVDVCDARTENYSIESIIRFFPPSNYFALGVSVFSLGARDWTNELIKAYKAANSNIKVFIGGYFPTLNHDIVMESIPLTDYATIGEGEKTVCKLVEAIWRGLPVNNIQGLLIRNSDGTVSETGKAEMIQDLNAIPLAKRFAHKYVDDRFEVLIEGSRGCPNDCYFCGIKGFFRTEKALCPSNAWRFRSAESIVDEITFLLKEYPAMKVIRFVDPDFFGYEIEGFERVKQFIRLVKEKNFHLRYCVETRIRTLCRIDENILQDFKNIGLRQIYIGIESGDNDMLKAMNKGIKADDSLFATARLKNIGIDYVFGFIMFTPWSTKKSIADNISLLKRLGGLEFDKLFHSLNIIPNTKWYDLAKSQGILRGMNDLGYYDYEFQDAFVAQMVKMWDEIEFNHIDFRDAIWYLYRDIKHCKSTGCKNVDLEEKDLSALSLEIFEKIYAIVENFPDDIEKKMQLHATLLEEIKKVHAIQCRIEPEFRVRRGVVNR